jgi:hypothetical protein
MSYEAAKSRCENPHDKAFVYYGARGIKFLFKDFPHFLAVMGLRPENKTIDRKNVNGHYVEGNVQWATCAQQRANQRRRSRVDDIHAYAAALARAASSSRARAAP